MTLETVVVTGLVETRHTLPDGEREVAKGALDKVLEQMGSAAGSDRERYDGLLERTPLADGVTLHAVDRDGVQGWWVRPARALTGRAILYVHGGGYRLGSAKAYRGFASQVAARAGVATFVVDYPLAPEHRFPAAYDAVLAARRWLTAEGVDQVALVGDSAGGGLALAAAGELGAGAPPVAAVLVFSPWVDLALTGSSFWDPNTRDPMFKPERLAAAAAAYLGGADARDGRASPLHSIPATHPPLAIQVGSDELLLDDARRHAVAVAEKGGEVRLDIFEGLHHVFQQAVGDLPSAGRALDSAASFLSRHWAEDRPQSHARAPIVGDRQ
jgi:acetyl esterase/lipase